MKSSKEKVIIYSSIFCLCLVVIGAIVWISKSRIPEPTYILTRHIQYSFTLRNQSDQVSKNVQFWTYAPVKQTPTQLCTNLESSHPYQMIADRLGNRIMHFTFDEIPPYGTKIIEIGADLRLADTPNPLSIEDSKGYLQSQEYCESDHPEILETARKLKDPVLSKTAENIFHWVADNVQYSGYLKNARGALYALKNKKGDCTEFMYLFAALCRASDIPCRCISGYICNKNSVLKPTSYHNWAEFYQDKAWRISDPQNRTFREKPADYIAMRIIGHSSQSCVPQFNRFRVEGNSIKAKMN